MRIVHVATTSLPVVHDRGGAVQRRIIGVARAQVERGHEVTIYSPGQKERLDIGGVKVEPIPLRTRRPLRDHEYLARVAQRVKRERPHVIHSHGLPDAGRRLGKHASVSTVITVDFFHYRLSGHRLAWHYYRHALHSYDWVLPVSNFCAEGLQAYYQLDGRQMSVVYNGVDLNQFFPSEEEAGAVRERYGIASPFVLYLGRVNRQKGSDMLPALAAELSNARVVAAGPLGQFGEQGASENLLGSSKVQYLGPVPESDLRGLLSAASLLVLPTRHDEMFGMVLVEAGACGTPSVASELGGIPEAMGAGGVLFKAGSVEDFIATTKSMLVDDELRASLSRRALENARRFDWAIIADAYLSLYEQPNSGEEMGGSDER